MILLSSVTFALITKGEVWVLVNSKGKWVLVIPQDCDGGQVWVVVTEMWSKQKVHWHWTRNIKHCRFCKHLLGEVNTLFSHQYTFFVIFRNIFFYKYIILVLSYMPMIVIHFRLWLHLNMRLVAKENSAEVPWTRVHFQTWIPEGSFKSGIV